MSGQNLSRTQRYSGRQRSRTHRQLAELPDQITTTAWTVAAVVTPAIPVAIVARRHPLRWWTPLPIAAVGVAAAVVTGHAWWIPAAPVAGELLVLGRLLNGTWPTWSAVALTAWAVAGGTVGCTVSSLLAWYRRRYRPTFETVAEVTDEQLQHAAAVAQWRPLDPDELVVGVGIDDLDDVVLTRADIARHALLVGESGTGKTVFLVQLCDWFLSERVRP